jgi:Ca2+-binding RTX toxin-like protein
MRGIKTQAFAAAALGVLLTAAPLVSTTTLPTAFGSDYNRVSGTPHADHLVGTGHDDLLAGRGGDDTVRPNKGSDIIRTAGGDDRIFLLNDGDVDRIHCGPGFDVVAYHSSVDQHDIIDANCEGRIA